MGQKWKVIVSVILSAAIVLVGGLSYTSSVQDALWNKTVTDILEVTEQGRHALDTYVEKDQEILHLFAAGLSEMDSRDGAALIKRMDTFGDTGALCICADLDAGIVYTNETKMGYSLDEEILERFRAMEGTGVREPFLDGRTGVWTIGCYERFIFADGAAGLIQKTQPLAEIAERFSLTFYQNTGFSYVVDREGSILIRSQHRNSNRTFQNLFDIIDLQGNDPEVIRSFREALENGKSGVARFQYQKADYVFCYVPMKSAQDWYVVSIIPNQVIMEQADSIVQHSRILVVIILGGVMLLSLFFLFYRNSMRRVFLAKEEARKSAESANAAKSRFLSNMSHDIRTPMNAIIGMTKLASDHVHEPDKVKEYLKNISQSGQLLVGLINDILDMSKIESGKMELNNDSASLARLLTGLVGIMQPTMQQKGQRFDIRLHHVEHEMLYFDTLRLNQVLLNLLSNAVKFTPEGGSIAVDVTESPAGRPGYTHFTFRVADSGIGMKPEFLEDIFVSFSREQDSRVNKTEGSGLGMAITKMIVDMMEGTITVESSPGEGSIFTVDVDFRLDEGPAPEAMSVPDLHVLVADDDPSTCQSAAQFLKELGARADVTTQGNVAAQRAVEAARQGKPYDLILLDWKMPDMGGVEVVREIRAQAGAQAPILVLSAYDWSCIEEEAAEAGVTGFIQKPFFKSTLYHSIRRYVLHEEQAVEEQHVRVELSGKRILVVEDNLLNREIARELLKSAGIQVETAENGLEGLELFRDSEPGYYDLILMDVHMPVMDGHEATRSIRALERPDASEIPIFAMTADAFTEDIKAAKAAGMNSHLAKPLDSAAMLEEIQKYLSRR